MRRPIGRIALAVVLFFLALGCPGDGSNLVDGILDPAPFILDDFEDGTVMGWTQGNNSPDPPTNIPDGGPDGIGDNYLETRSMGIVGPGSRLVMFNQAQWTGDYVTEGITRIEAQMANFGLTELFMRIAIEGAPSQRYGSTDAVVLLPDAQWRLLSFDLTAPSLTQIGGAASLSEVLSGVTTLRILSASTGPAWSGDSLVATLGVDDILAVN